MEHDRRLQYAQAGYLRWYGGPDVFFAQDNANGYVVTTLGSQLSSYGESHHYWVQADANCGCLHENVDLTQFQSTYYNPYNEWTTPFDVQWKGEANYRESDMPGLPGYVTPFTNLQVQIQPNLNYIGTVPPYFQNDDANYRWAEDNLAGQPNNGEVFDIWTSKP